MSLEGEIKKELIKVCDAVEYGSVGVDESFIVEADNKIRIKIRMMILEGLWKRQNRGILFYEDVQKFMEG